ncbi:MAG: hypothetical protein A2X58_14060 [Nitrospirae bacterium GWC2_56_14]|nr:MAG: hypothetical protein A2X58_14060 [Nitrospirae bacterium GWC2_56_14]
MIKKIYCFIIACGLLSPYAVVLAGDGVNKIVDGEWVLISAKDDVAKISEEPTKYLRYRFINGKLFIDSPVTDAYAVPNQRTCIFATPDSKKPDRIVISCPEAKPLYVIADRRRVSLQLCYSASGWPIDCRNTADTSLKFLHLVQLKQDPADARDPLSGLIGSWSNGRAEFRTLSFHLRRDGRGVFGTAVMSTLLRWSRTDSGILLKIAGGGKIEEMRLAYDPDSRTITYQKPDGTTEVFSRISLKEPPDIEAEAENKRRQEQKSGLVSTKHQEEFPTREGLLERLHSWAGVTSQPSNGLRGFVRSSDSSWQVNVTFFMQKYFVEVPIIQKSIDSRSPGINYTPCDADGEEPNIPTRFSLRKAHETALRAWLNTNGLAFSQYAQRAESPWQIEGYFRTISIGPIADRHTLFSVTNYLINDLFIDSKPPFSLITYESKESK